MTAETENTPPPVDNDHVAPGCEPFTSAPAAVDAAMANPDPRVPKVGKTVIVRRSGNDSPALIAEVTPQMLITAVVLRANHHLVETVKNLREIHPSEKLTGWYWPEG